MNRIRTFMWVLASMLILSDVDAGQTSNASIVELAIVRWHGNFVFIRLNQPPTSPASCSVNGYWHYTLSLDGLAAKELYAALLASQVSGKLVHATGNGACEEHGQIESLGGLNVVG